MVTRKVETRRIAPRQRYAQVVNKAVAFDPGVTDAIIREVMDDNRIPMLQVKVDRTDPTVALARIDSTVALDEERIKVPDHLYVWVK